MLSILAKLEHKIGDTLYNFMCPSNAPITEVKEALVQFLGHISNIEKAAVEAAAKDTSEAVPTEAPTAVEPSVVEAVKE